MRCWSDLDRGRRDASIERAWDRFIELLTENNNAIFFRLKKALNLYKSGFTHVL